MILKIRSMQPGENWHYVDRIARMTISDRKEEAFEHFKRRAFTVHDVVLIAGDYTWDEVDEYKGMKDPDSPTYDPTKDPMAPQYMGPSLIDEERENVKPHVEVKPGVPVMQARLDMAKKSVDNEAVYEKVVKFYEARCVNNDDKEFLVLFDGDLFLLNNLGKTIDHFDPQLY